MDQELKQRLIGAVVITALAAIFVPMLFDDDVDQTGKTINELTIPEVPAKAQDVEIMPLPEKAEDVATVIPVEKPTTGNPSKPAAILEEGVAEAIAAQPQPARQTAPATVVPPKTQEKPQEKTTAKNKPAQTFEGDADMPQGNMIAEEELPLKPAAKPAKPAPVTPPVVPVTNPPVTVPAKPTPKPVAATQSAPVPAPKAAAAPEGATRWYLNAGSFTQRANASALQENLKQQGFAASIKEAQGEKGAIYKVRIGPIQDKAKAQEVKNRLMQINVNTFFAAEE